MITQAKIIQILKKEQPYLRKEFGVKRIAIFGSFVQGTAQRKSDVDILVEFDKPPGLQFIHLADYLERKLGRKTDILTPGGIKGIRIKRIAEHIQRSLVYV